MGFLNKIKGLVKHQAVQSAVQTGLKVVKSRDHQTTILGAVAGTVMAANIDWTKLFAGDPAQVGQLAGAVAVGLLGFFTNKPAAAAK